MSKIYQYIVDVVARTKNFTQQMREVIRQTQETTRATKELSGTTGQFSGMLNNIGAGVIGAFSAKAVIDFTAEVTKLAAQADGVNRAFSRTASANDLTMLRDSVKGTVSDLELMKRAVTARNFGIPVQELGNLLEFAAKRAQDTGQEIDYLVDSIVTGIGRKSPLILDNLGISAVKLKEKLGGVTLEAASIAEITKAVGEIAKDSLDETGGIADNTATKLARMNAQWDNMKVLIGSVVAESSLLNGLLDRMYKRFAIDASPLNAWQRVNPFKSVDTRYQEALKANKQRDDQAAREQMDKEGKLTGKAADVVIVRNLQSAVDNLKIYKDKLAEAGKDTSEVSRQITEYEAQINKIQPKVPGAPDKPKVVKTAYEQLTLSIANLTKQQQALALAGADVSGITAQIGALQKQKQAADQLVESQKSNVVRTAYDQLSNSIAGLVRKQSELAAAGKDTSGMAAQITALERQKAVTDRLIQSPDTATAKTAYNLLAGSIATLVAQQDKLAGSGKDTSGMAAQVAALNRQKEAADQLARSIEEGVSDGGYEQLTEAIATLTKEQENLTLAGKDTTGIAAQIAALERQKEAVDFLSESYRVAARLGRQALELPANIITPKAAGMAQGLTVQKGKLASYGEKGEEPETMGLVIDPDQEGKTTAKIQEIIKQSEKLKETWASLTEQAGANFQTIGDAIGGMAGSWVGFFGYLIEQIPVLIAQITALSATEVAGSTAVTGAKSAEAIASGTAGAAKMPFPFSLIAIAATVAYIIAALANVTKVKKFEAGGIAYAPTLGMFGEYPGASSNPEVVAPLNRLREIIQPAGGSTVIMPAGVEIDGYKLRVLLKKVETNISRRT